MKKVHYDLLHKLAQRVKARRHYSPADKTIERMEEDPDAYLANILNLFVTRGLKPGGQDLESLIKCADYEPEMKKMRKLLDQEPSEYVPTQER